MKRATLPRFGEKINPASSWGGRRMRGAGPGAASSPPSSRGRSATRSFRLRSPPCRGASRRERRFMSRRGASCASRKANMITTEHLERLPARCSAARRPWPTRRARGNTGAASSSPTGTRTPRRAAMSGQPSIPSAIKNSKGRTEDEPRLHPDRQHQAHDGDCQQRVHDVTRLPLSASVRGTRSRITSA